MDWSTVGFNVVDVELIVRYDESIALRIIKSDVY